MKRTIARVTASFICCLFLLHGASRSRAQTESRNQNNGAATTTSVSVSAASSSVTLQAGGPPPGGSYSGSHALVIGNGLLHQSYYWDFVGLPYADRDTSEVASALGGMGFHVGVRSNVTKGEFDRLFDDFMRGPGADPDAQLLLYFLGRGYTEKTPSGEDAGYLLMAAPPRYNTRGVPLRVGENKATFDQDFVSVRSLVDRAKTARARHVLFVFDTSLSDKAMNLRESRGTRVVPDEASGRAIEFIAAGRADEHVPERDVFKVAFLDMIAGCAGEITPDGRFTGEALGAYVKAKVPENNPDQHPRFGRPGQHPRYGRIDDPEFGKGSFAFRVPNFVRMAVEPGKNFTEDLGGGVKLEMVWIPGGSFLMGSPPDENGRYDDEAQTSVTLGGFWMSKYEVTQEQYERFLPMRDSHTRSKEFKKGPRYPVYWGCDYFDKTEFIKRLSETTHKKFCFPTNEEWEYACRAGSTTRFSFGDSRAKLGDYAWYSRNSGGTPHPVGLKKPNAWGLYDMHGNVEEECPETGRDIFRYKTYRGGCAVSSPRYCRSANRKGDYEWMGRGIRMVPWRFVRSYTGFRVACIPDSQD